MNFTATTHKRHWVCR